MTFSAASASVRRRFDRLPIPTWVLAAIAAGVLVLGAALGGIGIKSAADAAAAAAHAKQYSVPALGVDMPLVAVVGDDLAVKEHGVIVWTKPLAAKLGVRLDRVGDVGAGYLHPGVGGETFVKRAATVSASSTLVVIVGGAHDAGERPAAITSAVAAAVAAAEHSAPNAKVVVVGPAVAAKPALTAAIRAGAAQAGAKFVDPIAAHWLSKTDVASGGTTLSAAGQLTFSDRMTATLKSLGVE